MYINTGEMWVGGNKTSTVRRIGEERRRDSTSHPASASVQSPHTPHFQLCSRKKPTEIRGEALRKDGRRQGDEAREEESWGGRARGGDGVGRVIV